MEAYKSRLFPVLIIMTTLLSLIWIDDFQVDARKTYKLKENYWNEVRRVGNSPNFTNPYRQTMNPITNQWCKSAMDGNDFFCVSEYLNQGMGFNLRDPYINDSMIMLQYDFYS